MKNYINHKSTGKNDPDLMQCQQDGCKVKNLRSTYILQGRHLCEKHWRELRESLAQKQE